MLCVQDGLLESATWESHLEMRYTETMNEQQQRNVKTNYLDI